MRRLPQMGMETQGRPHTKKQIPKELQNQGRGVVLQESTYQTTDLLLRRIQRIFA
jgi:hypothetical protein